MNATKKLVYIAALFVASTAANAQWYGDLTYLSATTKRTDSSSTVKSTPKTIGAFIGYEVNENFSAEGLIGAGIGETEVKVNGVSQGNPVMSKTDYVYGVFVKPRLKLNGEIEVFARLGYIQGKTTSYNSSGSSTVVKGDWAYGAGANYFFSKSTYITASWMNLYRKDNVRSDGLMVGLGLKF